MISVWSPHASSFLSLTRPFQPPNDPHGITKEELIQMLRDVLTGTPLFAEVGLKTFDWDVVTREEWVFSRGPNESFRFAAVSVTSHHRKAGLRRSELQAGLAADSGEALFSF